MPQHPDIALVVDRLREKYPNAKYELNWETPLQLLVATILAAQCTDERVNRVTVDLFPKYPNAAAYCDAPAEELEQIIRPTGTYKNKAKSIQGACRKLVEDFGGEVPQTMDELLALPGIQRKTANVILATAWNVPSGVIVDTHVNRVSERMGFSQAKRPEDKERDLMRLVPQEDWTFFGPALILHGRYTCTARAPRCSECPFNDVCPKLGLDSDAPVGGDTE
jgi:endonuclease III